MNLENPSRENIVYIVDQLKKKLTMANISVIQPDFFGLETYDDLLDLYNMIRKKERISISEMEAIVSELGTLRKK
jgi:uncharacterized protein YfkK (UPF0435 family)